MENCTQARNNCYSLGNISDDKLIISDKNGVSGNSTNSSTPYSNIDLYELPSTAERAIEIFTKTTDVISIVICLFGITANVVSIVAVANLRQKMTTHLKLIISLCVSDGLILLANMFLYILYILSPWYECIRITARLTTDIALLATLINLLVMALDHYGAITKPLRYRQKMTNLRGNCVVVGVWTVSSLGALIEVFLGISSRIDPDESLCAVIANGRYDFEFFIVVFIFFVLFGIGLIYGLIYTRVRKAMPGRERASCHTDSGSLKALMTTVLFVGTFVVFWAPLGICNIYMYVKSTDIQYVLKNLERITLITDILYVIMLLNALADPLVYAFRLPKVKRGFTALFASQSRSSEFRCDKTSTKHQHIENRSQSNVFKHDQTSKNLQTK
ncbi:melanocortin receptor 5-like [Mercenaria mercenaria]|uniref:melanocortin receptor 5-like n=1 Tax=Mercenaria mercenaria TaxID=6596 RepID=UPI00234ECDAD|nr:melanocortin receptor 5-like [Mercenaria mercenaria]